MNKNGKLMNDSMQWGAIRWSVLASVSLLALTGCAVPQAFQTPAVTLPAAYSQATGTPVQGQAASADDWWLAFNDPQLNALVTDVLARNNNLAAASLEGRLLLTRGRAREANSGFDLMHD